MANAARYAKNQQRLRQLRGLGQKASRGRGSGDGANGHMDGDGVRADASGSY